MAGTVRTVVNGGAVVRVSEEQQSTIDETRGGSLVSLLQALVEERVAAGFNRYTGVLVYEVNYVNMKSNVALRALPVYLREENPHFFKSWNMCYNHHHHQQQHVTEDTEPAPADFSLPKDFVTIMLDFDSLSNDHIVAFGSKEEEEEASPTISQSVPGADNI
ncbi:hypothetical protein F2P81_025516 [Scophthalmus maximus]|uniref:Uncharacterized protein n=1 Tax=Scophthalmus maximus TaxID=52904 RepID=A0A6A4RSN9_SCOMX|nr:hypothetical protein F2P81_025516 [Scophthalmus maximus]